MSTKPVRVDSDLFESAQSAGAANSRSAAQQFSHWARIGRALESSGAVSTRDIERVLAGEASYDVLGDREQAVVRAEWDERIATELANLNLAQEFDAAGESWSEADAAGRVVAKGSAG